MATVAVNIPTTRGDAINPVVNWNGYTSATVPLMISGNRNFPLFTIETVQVSFWDVPNDPPVPALQVYGGPIG